MASTPARRTKRPSNLVTVDPTSMTTTVSTMSKKDSASTVSLLGQRLVSLVDLQLTLKHIHWNVVGMNFISVHQMLDVQVDGVRLMSDAVAERIATLGGEPIGTPGAVVSARTWGDYELGRAPAVSHLMALDSVYDGVVTDHRAAVERLDDLDKVSQDLLIGQLGELEQYQWFVRAHLKDSSGDVAHRESRPSRKRAR